MKTGIFACSLALLCCAGAVAQPVREAIDLHNPGLFPPEFFPDLAGVSEGEVLLEGLRSLYPKRILAELPEEDFPEPTPPVVRELEGSGLYIRIKHLPEALPVIRESLSQPVLVLDFRFLATDIESTLALGALLTRQEAMELSLVGDYPVPASYLDGSNIVIRGEGIRGARQTVFTLSNHETEGPLEALLAQLKNDSEIISVGSGSPGKVAAFGPFPGLDSFYLIRGEIRPANGRSLLESGFLPQVHVNVPPEEDAIAYRSLRKEVSLNDLIEARVEKPRFDEARLLRERAGEPAAESGETTEDQPALPQDILLQRALNIVKALQALGKIEGRS